MKKADKLQQPNKTIFGAKFTVNSKLDNYRHITPKAKIDNANFLVAHLDMNQLAALVLEQK